MTKNQIEFNKLRETQRNNRQLERLTAQRDLANRKLGLSQLQETARHNLQVELQARDNLAETYRNNQAYLDEQHRAHLAQEGIARLNADTQQAVAAEQARHNLAAEDVSLRSMDLNRYIAEIGADSKKEAAEISAAASRAAASVAAAASMYSSDQMLAAKELQAEIDRYSIDTNAELRSADLAERQRAAISSLGETVRSNRANESLRQQSQAEQQRSNLAQEALALQRIQSDVSLRQEQNRIAQQNADIAQQRVNIDIPLRTSETVGNYIRAGKDLVSTAASLVPGT